MDYVVEGIMIGGFALVAAPAEYGETGVKTFMVSHTGVVYEKDLGPGTLEEFQKMERFNPDKSWMPVADEPPKEWDGLARVSSKKLDHVYKLPEADFSGYKRVRLDPIEVEFDKNWKPNDSTRSPSSQLANSDLEKIKKTLAGEF